MATQKWNYQGGGIGQEEQGIRRPIDPTPNVNHQGLGFGCPSHEASSSAGTSRNNGSVLVDIEDMHEEVVKQAYNDIDSSSSIGTSHLFDISILLIDLPLFHLELID